jgi:hypothetical protein
MGSVDIRDVCMPLAWCFSRLAILIGQLAVCLDVAALSICSFVTATWPY